LIVAPPGARADHGGLHHLATIPLHLLSDCWVANNGIDDPSTYKVFPTPDEAWKSMILPEFEKRKGQLCLCDPWKPGSPYGAIDYYEFYPFVYFTASAFTRQYWRSPGPGEYDFGPAGLNIMDTVVEYHALGESAVALSTACDSWNGYQRSCGSIYIGYVTMPHYSHLERQLSECLAKNYRVWLEPAYGYPQSTSIVASAEPGTTINLIARVYDQSNQPAPNVSVRIEATSIPNSGGHQHPDAQRPKGKFNGNSQNPPVVNGTTDASGGFSFTYTAPDVSGDYKLTASCNNCTQEGTDQIWVGIKDLVPLPNDSAYVLLPNPDYFHPENHFLTMDAESRLLELADLYRQTFPSEPRLHLNDASLERGGLFDFGAKDGAPWKPGHKTHRFGAEIDIRANPQVQKATAIPEQNFEQFEEYVARVRGTLCPETGVAYAGMSKQHYHVCLMGGDCCQGGNR